ncbi:F-box/WD repeat-containing protein 7-like isoform X2 [Procambarus clarkii]|uniref:F-box/WD repeat-containing protein 7-like isoform X2 n=1 Tax=Procambarus clarkii TaxID=6728 RepID=UPI003744493F
MMGDRVVDINVATVEDLETLVGVGRAKAEAIVTTRNSMVEFRSVDDLLLVPGIGRSLIEQNRGLLVCSIPGGAPVTRHSAPRRSLRRTSHDHRQRGECVKSEESSHEVQGDNTNCASSQAVKPTRINLRDLNLSATLDQFRAAEHTSATRCVQCKNDLRPKEELRKEYDEERREGENDKREVALSISGDTSDCCECCLEDEEEEEKEEDDGEVSVDVVPVIQNNDGERNGDIVEDIMNSDDLVNTAPEVKIKRKSEVCSDSKGVCPVKKSCKAVEHSGESSRRKVCGLAAHKVSPPPVGLKSWLAKYQTWSPAQKRHALDSLIDVCDLNEVRHLHQIILPQFQRDFISLLPKELALYVLSFLPPKDLLRAAQTCKYWNILAADNLLWREKCREAGIDDHMIVMDRRRRRGTSVSHMSPFKAAFMRQHRIEMNWRATPLRPPRVLKGHDDHVITCLQFSGNTIVSGSDDNTLKVWNATSGKCMRTLTGHTGGVWSSQMSGNLIVSGSTDRMLRVWDAETGECHHTLYGHTSTVRCLHLHGSKVVSGSRDATLRVWDVNSGACEHVLVGHVAAVRCVQYNGRLVVSGAYDYMVKVWNADREECLHTLQGHTNRVYSLQFDGIHVVSGSLDTSIRVWDVETGQCRHTLMGHQSLTSGMELKNNILISGNADSTVKVWDIVTGQCLQTLSGPNKHRSAVTCLQFNNKFVVTSSDDGTVKLWDVRTGEFLRNLVALESGGSGGVVWRIRASDTKLVCAVGSRNGTEETKLLVLDFDVYENLK